MFLPTATRATSAPRLTIREVGASVTVQTLSLPRTVSVTCGFSYFDVSIGPATVTGLAAS